MSATGHLYAVGPFSPTHPLERLPPGTLTLKEVYTAELTREARDLESALGLKTNTEGSAVHLGLLSDDHLKSIQEVIQEHQAPSTAYHVVHEANMFKKAGFHFFYQVK